MKYRLPRKNEGGSYLLQLTSMVDMFTIILVFLLKSYSTSAYQVTPSDHVKLPVSKSQSDPEEGVKISLSLNAIQVEDQLVMQWTEPKGWKPYLRGQKGRFLPELQRSLKEQKKKKEELKKWNESIDTKEHLVLQIDKGVPYELVRSVMATSSLVGFNSFQLLTLKE